MVAREFAKRYADQGIVSTSCNPGESSAFMFPLILTSDPGNIKTELQRYAPSFLRSIMVCFNARDCLVSHTVTIELGSVRRTVWSSHSVVGRHHAGNAES